MTRVAMFGLGPMRWEQSTRLFALPLRTWHFAATLARDGHDVTLLSMRTAAFEGWPPDKVTKVVREGVTIYSLSEHVLHERPDWVRARLREHAPECVVGVNRDPAAIAANFADDVPFWADINGDPMAEAQAKAEVEGSDAYTKDFFWRFVPVLMRADRFSTCSSPQRAALIGQLSMIGRLTAGNAGVDLVHAIPNSIDHTELALLGAIERAPRAPGEPFVVLWSGGYNTWADPDLLFETLERAMAREPSIRFVSTGGAIGGHYTQGYERFRARVAGSVHAARYHFAGWVQTAELPAYYGDAHAAILTDRFGYEGVLGARTRMLDWLAAGLPIVTTRLSEISHEVEARGAGLTARCGDAEGLAEHLVALAADPELAARMGAAGRAYAQRELRADRQLEALRDWARRPTRAPDGERRVDLPAHGAAGNELRSLARQWVESTRRGGIRAGLGDARRFATRRARHTVQRTLDRAGLPGGVRVIELDASEAPLHEAPRAGALQWRRRLGNGAGGPSIAVVIVASPDDSAEVLGWTVAQLPRQYAERWSAVVAVQPGGPWPGALPAGVEAVDAARANPMRHRAVRDADYVMLLGVGDLLRPDALAELMEAARDNDADLVYGDEQPVDETNAPRPTEAKPPWDPEALLSRAFLGRCVAYRRSRAELDDDRVASWPIEALAHDLALRASDVPATAHRVRRVLVQRYVGAGAAAASQDRQRRAAERSIEAVRDALWRRGVPATVERGRRAQTFGLRYPLPDGVTLTLAVPTSSAAPRALASLRARSRLPGLEAVALEESAAPLPSRIDDALRASEADLVGWLLPDAEVVTDGWDEAVARHACRPDVAAASPRVVDAAGRQRWPHPEALTDASALPPHCVVFRRDAYVDAGGLEGQDLPRALAELLVALRQRGRLVCAEEASVYLRAEAPGAVVREP